MADAPVGYVLDTCDFCYLNGENQATRYSNDATVTERVWQGLEALISDKRSVTSMWLRREMKEWCPLAYERVRRRRGFFLRDTPEILEAMGKAYEVAEERTRNYLWNRPANKESADPYLIAVAMVTGFTIVTGELERAKRSAKKRREEKIPDWCKKIPGVTVIHFDDLVRAEGWA